MKRILAFLLLALMMPAPASALQPERREVIVVSGRVWDGFAYKENFLPSTFPELSLLADKDSAISFVRTQEYYWPLARQVYVDFESEKQDLDGVLRIEQDGKVVAEIAKSAYSIVYPKGAINGDGALVWATEAEAAYAAYQAEEMDFNRRYVDIQRQNTLYERRLIESGAARMRGEKAEVIAPPPALPEPSLRLVTQPVSGFRLQLAPGRYTMALYEHGNLVPGTRRALRILDSVGRRTTVADIVPEERWTRPLASNSTAARVFARPGSVFYMTLSDADRFDEAEYLPVVTPQAEAVAGRNMWVRRKPADDRSMAVAWNASNTETIGIERLKVEQTEGSGFGYRVRLARPGEKEDLNAFMVAVPPDGAISRGLIGAEGKFSREIVIVHPRNSAIAGTLSLTPLAAWMIFVVLQRRRNRAGMA